MTKFFTASRWRCTSAAFTRTRHETMTTTTDLTVVEQYNVDDRQSPRTQSADTRPLPLDCSRLPVTTERLSPIQASTSEILYQHKLLQKTQQMTVLRRQKTRREFPWTQLNIGRYNLASLVNSLRLKVKLFYTADPAVGHSISMFKLKLLDWNHIVANWWTRSHLTCRCSAV